MDVKFYIPGNDIACFPSQHFLINTWYCQSLMLAILVGECVFLLLLLLFRIANEIDQPFLCLLGIF